MIRNIPDRRSNVDQLSDERSPFLNNRQAEGIPSIGIRKRDKSPDRRSNTMSDLNVSKHLSVGIAAVELTAWRKLWTSTPDLQSQGIEARPA